MHSFYWVYEKAICFMFLISLSVPGKNLKKKNLFKKISFNSFKTMITSMTSKICLKKNCLGGFECKINDGIKLVNENRFELNQILPYSLTSYIFELNQILPHRLTGHIFEWNQVYRTVWLAIFLNWTRYYCTVWLAIFLDWTR